MGAKDALLNALLLAAKRFSLGPPQLLTQICLALSALMLHAVEHGKPIEKLFCSLQSLENHDEGNIAVLEMLTVLPEVVEDQNTEYRISSAQRREYGREVRAGCFSEIPPNCLAGHPLLSFVFNSLQVSSSFDLAIEVLTELVSRHEIYESDKHKGKKEVRCHNPEVDFELRMGKHSRQNGEFLSSHRKEVESTKPRLVDNNFPFAEAVRSIKWTNRKGDGVNAQATLMKEEGIICINESSNIHNEVLQRSLVGDFEGRNNVLPNLAEVRSWANKFWRQSHGLNIYEMGVGKFLFEFAMKTMAEQVIVGGTTRGSS
ncbi:hypothetical protein MTR67_011105 [Solanum verrucosum]|uniref:DUF4283 domain-containing protein n=1 Tax=Solanum verrucosum TaxID=315347 RepID=A0AAF0Q8W2_SOLVR|nr:hypothetical protein MTR67_011105 [Solanum verrucosum]